MLEGYPSILIRILLLKTVILLRTSIRLVKEVYASMFDEKDIQKLMNLSVQDFKTAFSQIPSVAQKIVIEKYATQIENGTFNDLGKAKIIDEICGTRFDLKY